MAMPRRFPVVFGEAFPHGLYAISEVSKARDWNASTAEVEVQARDVDKNGEGSGKLIWTVEVMDADPGAPKAQKSFTLRVTADVQPVLPAAPEGTPFVPIELEGLSAAPYVAELPNGRGRLAWSYRCTGIKPVASASHGARSGAKDAA